MIQFRLRELMQKNGVTYKQVSQGASVSTNTLYKMKHNKQKHVGVGVLGRLLEYFDCEPNDLIIRV